LFQQIDEYIAGSIEIIPAKTGNANNRRMAVINIAQPNKGTLCNTCPGILIFNTVVMTFINKKNFFLLYWTISSAKIDV